jgi:hypothetical protein
LPHDGEAVLAKAGLATPTSVIAAAATPKPRRIGIFTKPHFLRIW